MTIGYLELLDLAWKEFLKRPLLYLFLGALELGSQLFLFLPFFCSLGTYRVIQLKRGDQPAHPSDFFWYLQNGSGGFSVIIQFLVFMALVGVGALFLVVPGIWFFIAGSLALPAMVLIPSLRGGLGGIHQSVKWARGRWLWLLGFLLFQVLLSLLGILFFGIGLVVAAIVKSLMIVALVEHLTSSGTAPTAEGADTSTLGGVTSSPSVIKVSP